jgi:signal transduction histidine kinase
MLAIAVLSLPGFGPTFAVLLPSSVVYLLVVATAAAGDDLRISLASAGIGVVGAALIVAIALVRDELAPRDAVIVLAGFLIASLGAAWAIGRYRRESRRRAAAVELGRRQALELELQHRREADREARRTIERDIHDVVSHSLAVMVAQAEASRLLAPADPAGADAALGDVVATGRAALSDMRGLLRSIAGPDADAAPASRQPSPRIRDIAQLAARAAAPGRDVECTETGEPRPVPPGTEVAAFRVVQEGLTNTFKHADPPTVSRVTLDWGSSLVVSVQDDGTGGGTTTDDGRGVRGLRERVAQCGGTLESGPRSGGGWLLRATFPIGREAAG